MSEDKGNKNSTSERIEKSLDPSAVIQRPLPNQPQPTQANQGGGGQKPGTPEPSKGEGKK